MNQLGQWFAGLPRRIWFLFTSCYAPCTTIGAATGGLAWMLNGNWQTGFLLGFCISIWPVAHLNGRPERLKKLMDTAKQWKEAGYIKAGDYTVFCREVLFLYQWLNVGISPRTESKDLVEPEAKD